MNQYKRNQTILSVDDINVKTGKNFTSKELRNIAKDTKGKKYPVYVLKNGKKVQIGELRNIYYSRNQLNGEIFYISKENK